MMTGTTLMDSNEREALERGRADDGQPEPQETTLVPMLVWGLVLIIIGMVFAVMVS
jgi:hypothetical protein